MAQQIHKTSRLYYPQDISINAGIRIEGQAHHYLRNVMRKQKGDIIRLFNPKDGEFSAILDEPQKKYVTATIQEQLRPPFELRNNNLQITLACPILPKDRMDMMIEKAVELGATVIQPLIFEHSSVRKLKTERVDAQMIEAAEQCERLDIPTLAPIASFDTLLHHIDPNSTHLIALERSDAIPLPDVLGDIDSAQNITYIIGPEGGFSDDERARIANNTTAKPVTLGSRILRAETAAIYGLSVIQSHLDA